MTGITEWENWESVHEALADIEYKEYSKGDDEITYINEIINNLGSISNSTGGEHIHSKVYKAHGRPFAEFDIPGRSKQQTCEIADLCFDIEIKENGTLEERRAFLSQSKMSSRNSQKWKIQLNQHYFLNYFPPFSSSDLGPDGVTKGYNISAGKFAFSNYSLASKHDQPVYCSGLDLARRFSNLNYQQKTTTYRHGSTRSHLSTTVGLMSDFANGCTGADLQSSKEKMRLVDDLIEYAKDKGRVQPDGGQSRRWDDRPRFAVVRIIIDREV